MQVKKILLYILFIDLSLIVYFMELAGVILCGGKSSRMGEDKGLIKFKGKQMVEYSIHLLNYFTNNIFLSTSNEVYQKFNYPIIPDIKLSLGPIGGIFSVMSAINANKYFILSCDIPFITKELIEGIINNYEKSDIVVPISKDKRIHPLVGLYSRSIFPIIENQINSQNYKMLDLLSECNTFYYMVDNPKILKNINSRKDLTD